MWSLRSSRRISAADAEPHFQSLLSDPARDPRKDRRHDLLIVLGHALRILCAILAVKPEGEFVSPSADAPGEHHWQIARSKVESGEDRSSPLKTRSFPTAADSSNASVVHKTPDEGLAKIF